ncbi:MAG: hypothetical protein PHC52_00670 [Syntrophales bacterium]|nr:hypothetical protein [Syntrophales bacterium]
MSTENNPAPRDPKLWTDHDKARISARDHLLLSVMRGIILDPEEMNFLLQVAESGYHQTMALCRILTKVRQAPPLHGG